MRDWIKGVFTITKNKVLLFALLCVAVTSGYDMWMGYVLNETLSGPGWCRTALGAEQASNSNGVIKGLDACVGLLTIQIKSIATNSHILFGVVALCLAVLIVIVIAGGKVDVEASREGGRVKIGRELPDTPEAAAAQVADVASEEAANIAEGANHVD
jgi:hypothetical protein